jgi:trimeric autotransporter adhesin
MPGRGVLAFRPMPMSKKALVPTTAFALLMVVACVSCRGFFVNPQLSSIAVTPDSPSIKPNASVQLTATGSNTDGSTTSNLPNLTWTTSDASVAAVSSTGLVRGVAVGTATITATSGAVSGSTSVTVSNTTNTLTISPQNSSVSQSTQSFVNFTATSNGTTVTSSANWTSSNNLVATFATPGTATIVGQGTTTITATFTPSGGSQQTASTTLTVTQ